MPYADPERQRAAKRESARRRRAEGCGTAVEPAVPAPAAPFPTGTELARVSQMLRLDWQVGESPAAFHLRLKEAYALLVRVCT